MFREMEGKDLNFANDMIRKINTSAVNVFNEAYNNKEIDKCFIYETNENKGILVIIKTDSYFSIQLSFDYDIRDYETIQFIEQQYKEVLQNRENRDIYFNINASNSMLQNYFIDSTYERDSYGFEFYLSANSESAKKLSNYSVNENIKVKKYEKEHLMEYLHLLDEAFRQQQIECNEEQDGYCKVSDKANIWLQSLSDNNNFQSFWVNNEVVGLYIIDDNYIDIIAVHPRYEKKGYGSEILKSCVNEILYNRKYSDIYLVTYFQNKKAQRLYLKNGFIATGFYSENTYIINK